MKNLTQINNLTKSGEWAISDRGFMNLMTRDREQAQSFVNQSKQNDMGCSMSPVEYVREDLSIMFNQRQPMQVNNNFAITHVYGGLLQDASPLDLGMGNSSYGEIIADIEQAEASPLIDTTILCIDSPGGMVSGMLECANTIRESSNNTVAFIAGHATSAAYALASQCDMIVASPSSTSGNIGTVLSWSDFSKFWSDMGIVDHVMTNEGADLKGTFREFPMSDSQSSFLQARIDQLGTEFWDLVTAVRPQVDTECKRAGWYQPDDAGRLGLIDAVSTESELMSYLSENIDTLRD